MTYAQTCKHPTDRSALLPPTLNFNTPQIHQNGRSNDLKPTGEHEERTPSRRLTEGVAGQKIRENSPEILPSELLQGRLRGGQQPVTDPGVKHQRCLTTCCILSYSTTVSIQLLSELQRIPQPTHRGIVPVLLAILIEKTNT